MKFNDRLLEDFVRVAGGAASLLTGLREAGDKRPGDRPGFETVSREEFEAVRDMAAKARETQEMLERRVAELEAATAGRPQYVEQP